MDKNRGMNKPVQRRYLWQNSFVIESWDTPAVLKLVCGWLTKLLRCSQSSAQLSNPSHPSWARPTKNRICAVFLSDLGGWFLWLTNFGWLQLSIFAATKKIHLFSDLSLCSQRSTLFCNVTPPPKPSNQDQTWSILFLKKKNTMEVVKATDTFRVCNFNRRG